MISRRNPQRKCKADIILSRPSLPAKVYSESSHLRPCEPTSLLSNIQRKNSAESLSCVDPISPFRFFDLPKEIRDQVYSYLVVRRGRKVPIIEAKAILRDQKKRATAQRTRQRLNEKRQLCGKPPVSPRVPTTEPIVFLNLLQVSRSLNLEATDYMYQSNWFAITLDSFPVTTIDAPGGWRLDRIAKMQLELQLKDSQRMNNYIDWTSFFTALPCLRFLRIIPTFHPRYHTWAQTELDEWKSVPYIFRSFFRELLASIPEAINLKLGPSSSPQDDVQMEGRALVSANLLRDMYVDLGSGSNNGHRREWNYTATSRVVDGCNALGRLQTGTYP